MPSARADEFRRAAIKLDFERWIHEDGRATTIPIHGGREIGAPLFYRIIRQLGISAEEFDRLR